MSYSPIYARQVQLLREEMGATSTDEALEILTAAVIEMRELYETPPKLRKAEGQQHERNGN